MRVISLCVCVWEEREGGEKTRKISHEHAKMKKRKKKDFWTNSTSCYLLHSLLSCHLLILLILERQIGGGNRFSSDLTPDRNTVSASKLRRQPQISFHLHSKSSTALSVEGSDCGLDNSQLEWTQRFTPALTRAFTAVDGAQRQLGDYKATEKMRKDEQTNEYIKGGQRKIEGGMTGEREKSNLI